GKQVSEAVLFVVLIARSHERVVGRPHGDVAGDATGDHERYGDDLAAQGAQVPKQLPIERTHHEMSRARFCDGLARSETIRPSARETTRSAIWATGAL